MLLRALLACALVGAAGCTIGQGANAAGESAAEGPVGISSARLLVPLDVYPHRIMGDIREKAVLEAVDTRGRTHRIDLRDAGQGHNVFEDIAPRVVDADGDGRADVVVVESSQTQGAQLAIYGLRRDHALVKTASTPHIGTRFRWLAPVAIADMDRNGTIDLAFVDRPHLARTLQVWSWQPGGLSRVATLEGVTNHRIGDEVIWGGLRECGEGPEMVVAEADWSGTVAVRFDGTRLTRRALPQPATKAGFDAALGCGG